MIKLNNFEVLFVSGGLTVGGDDRSYPDQFMSSFVQAAGTGSGVIASPLVVVGMVAYGIVYYGVYAPLYYIATGGYHAVAGGASLTYNAGASAASLVTGK